MDRPPADPAKLLSSWREWETGETPPGRVVADLKTGGLRDLLEHVALEAATDAPPEGVAATDALATWMEWETGQTPPGEVMTRLHAAGVPVLLDGLATAAAGASAADTSPEG